MRVATFVFSIALGVGLVGCSRKAPPQPAASGEAPPLVASPVQANAGTCRVVSAVQTLDKGVRPDTGVTFGRLLDGRMALGFAGNAGSPRVAVFDVEGSGSMVDVDASAVEDLAEKPGPRVVRLVHRVVPWSTAGLAVAALVDSTETRPDGTRIVRCGPTNGEAIAKFEGTSAFEKTAGDAEESLPITELRDCRSFAAEKPWALASEATIGADGEAESRWVARGAGAGDLEVIATKKIPAEKGHARPRGAQVDRFGFTASSVVALGGAGWLATSRHNGRLVVAKLGDDFRAAADVSDTYYGAPVGRAALAFRDGRLVIVAALNGKADVLGASFPLEGKAPKLAPLSVDDATPIAPAERAAAAVAPLGGSETALAFVQGKGADRRARVTLLDASLKARGAGVQPFGEAEVHAVDVTALAGSKVVVSAIITQAGAGQILQSTVLDCGAL